VKTAGLLATRRSLVERLADWGDQLRWQEFFDTYWKLIYSAARQSGLIYGFRCVVASEADDDKQ